MDFSVIDNLSGVGYIHVIFRGHIQSGWFSTSINGGCNLEEDFIDIPLEFPQTVGGDWYVSDLYVRDCSDNSQYFFTDDLNNIGSETNLFIINNSDIVPPEDDNPPELTYFSFSPDTVNLNSRNPVEFILEGTDDLSGFDGVGVYLYTEDMNNYMSVSNWGFSGDTQISEFSTPKLQYIAYVAHLVSRFLKDLPESGNWYHRTHHR